MTTDQWALVVGAVLPALVAIVNRAEWKPWIKGLVALAISVVAGTVTALLAGDFTGKTWLQAVGIVFAASQASYFAWWKGTDIAGMIERVINVLPGRNTQSTAEGNGD